MRSKIKYAVVVFMYFNYNEENITSQQKCLVCFY